MKPFREIELRNVLARQTEKMRAKVERFTNDEIMANDLELLADNLYEEFFIPPVIIHEEENTKRTMQQAKITRPAYPFVREFHEQTHVEVDGYVFTFCYPYEGETDLFKCQASTISCSPYPEFMLRDGFLILKYEKTINEMKKEGAKDELIKALERDIKSINEGVGYANNDVVQFNQSLRSSALTLLKAKKEMVEDFFAVASLFEIPLTKTTYSASHIPLQRKISPIAHTYDRQPFYCILDKDYTDILATIKHTGSTFERTPASYKSLHEEDMRNILLATLNGTYMGDATGEAFRNHGKTDICIERENRAAFVAECKMWTGSKEVQAALEQLDSYLTWRDCKTALIYFVRRKNFMSILTTAETTLKSIPFMRQVVAKDRNEFKCCMVSTNNPGQIVQVRVILFNLNA